jgi:hypothetical protein
VTLALKVLPAALLTALLVHAADSYREELLRWRAQREASLKAEDGWLSVAGLFYLILKSLTPCISK